MGIDDGARASRHIGGAHIAEPAVIARRRAGSSAPVVLCGLAVLTAYALTLARTVTRWDAGEFLAAVHSLGIPHPPGTPLYVLLARVWAMLPLPYPFAVRVNLFSAICAATAVTLLGVLVGRWTRNRVAGVATTLCAGGTYTLWMSATEAEVYAPALLFAVLLLVAADTHRVRFTRKCALIAFIAGVGWTLHPSALVTLPAAGLLAWSAEPSPPSWRRAWPAVMAAVVCAFLGLSAVLYLFIRAQHDPAINQGNPNTLTALWEVLTRAQYPSVGVWRRQAPLWLQLGNWFEYADWQFAFGLGPSAPPSVPRTSVTLLFAAVGAAGIVVHRRVDRRSWRALMLTFLVGVVGLILYLNMKLGPSYGHGILPAAAVREARERDYFFILSFVVWAAWGAIGAVFLAEGAAKRWTPVRRPLFAGVLMGSALALVALPLALNFAHVREQRATASERTRREAISLLAPLPTRAVFLAIGDNDTYPLWYLQEVERIRRDILVVTLPLLAAPWYRDELARRHEFVVTAGTEGTLRTVREVCMIATAQSRDIYLTPLAPSGVMAACPELRVWPGATNR